MAHKLIGVGSFVLGMAFSASVFAEAEGVKGEFDAEEAKKRDVAKTASDPTCVFPVVEDGATLLKYVGAELETAGAPKGLDISLSFDKDIANIKFASAVAEEAEAEEYVLNWKLPAECKGEITWLMGASDDSPAWLGKLQTTAFASGIPLVPKSVSLFKGDSYEVSKGDGTYPASAGEGDTTKPSRPREGEGLTEDGRLWLGLGMGLVLLVLVNIGRVFRKKKD